MNLTENAYILYRKVKAIISWLIYFCFAVVFPVKTNKIVFSAFEGNGYGCNPKYIADEIIRRDTISNEKHELVWLVNDTNKEFPQEVVAVKNNLFNRAYHLSTAKVWVDNARKKYGTRKRDGQLYIQTWHGPIGVKPEGRRRGKTFSKIARIVTKYDASLVDYFLINSKLAEIDFRGAFYGEPLLKTGSPRCDILINRREEQYIKVRNTLGLPIDAKLLMYAPTFRGGSQNKVRVVEENKVTLDFNKILETFEKRFGGVWYLILRLHPQLALRDKTLHISGIDKSRCIDVSKKDDLYEYMAGMDAFLSDYSSALADASLMKIPVFVYADDLKKYTADRGNLLYDIHLLPYPISETEEELIRQISDFNDQQYIHELVNFFEKIELLEDGKASERVVELIETYVLREANHVLR